MYFFNYVREIYVKRKGRNVLIGAWLPQMTNDFNNSFNLLAIIVKEYVFLKMKHRYVSGKALFGEQCLKIKQDR